MTSLTSGDPCQPFTCELERDSKVAMCKNVMLDTGSVKTLVPARGGQCARHTHESFMSLTNLQTCEDPQHTRRHFVPDAGMTQLRAQLPGLDALHGIGFECGDNKCIRNAHVDLSGCLNGGNCFIEVNRATEPKWVSGQPAASLENSADWCDVAPKIGGVMFDTGSDACAFSSGMDTYVGFDGMRRRQMRMYVDYEQKRAYTSTNGFTCPEEGAQAGAW